MEEVSIIYSQSQEKVKLATSSILKLDQFLLTQARHTFLKIPN